MIIQLHALTNNTLTYIQLEVVFIQMFKLSKSSCSIKRGIQRIPDLCTFIVETIKVELAECLPHNK